MVRIQLDGSLALKPTLRYQEHLRGEGSIGKIKEGTTIHGLNLLLQIENNLTWTRLKQALVERYGVIQCDNPFEELKDLQQIVDVEEYITEFECISSLNKGSHGRVFQ
jgi:hypothetical protein